MGSSKSTDMFSKSVLKLKIEKKNFQKKANVENHMVLIFWRAYEY